MPTKRQIHATAVARDKCGVLLLGPPGAGKSDLALRLIGCGFALIADDQVVVDGLCAAPPAALAGLIEVRGLGVVRMPFVTAPLVLAVALRESERLPENGRCYPDLDLPLIDVDARAASAALRVSLALDCLIGRLPMEVGVFA